MDGEIGLSRPIYNILNPKRCVESFLQRLNVCSVFILASITGRPTWVSSALPTSSNLPCHYASEFNETDHGTKFTCDIFRGDVVQATSGQAILMINGLPAD